MKPRLSLLLGLGIVCFAGGTRAEENAPPAPQVVALSSSAPPDAPPATAAPAPVPSTVVAKPAPKPPGKFLVHANFAFNVYTYLSEWGDGQGAKAETHLHPGNRAVIFQQLGFGYFFHKMLRVQLTFQVGETLTGLPEGKNTVALFGIIPWLVFAHKGATVGIGPIFAPISANTVPRFDGGIFSAAGYTFKLPKNFSLSALCQFIFLFNERTTIAITPAVALAYRF